MKHLNTTTIVLIAILLLGSCSKRLTREKAAQMITDFYQYPNVEFATLKLEEFGKRDESSLQNAVRNGYLNLSKDGYAAYAMMGSGNVYSFTKKSKPFIVNTQMGFFGSGSATIVSNSRVFNEITGIKEDEVNKTAIVEFSCKRRGVTPLGEILGYRNDDIVSYKVNFTLYDDGWRIADKQNNVKVSDYTFFSKDGDYIEQEYLSCDSKYELSGKLLGVFYLQEPCSIPYLSILTSDGKKEELYLDLDLDNFKANNKGFFNWPSSKIQLELANDPSQIELQFPNEAFDASILNKPALFCCYKSNLNCGDDPSAPKSYFCNTILVSTPK